MVDILDFLYPYSYLLSLGSLVSWFFVQKNKSGSRIASRLFLISFLVYLVSLSWSSGTLSYKLLVLFRDMAVMTVVSQLFNISRKNTLLAILLAVASAGSVYFAYFPILKFTFPQIQLEEIEADAEFIVELREAAQNSELTALAARFNFTVEPAFRLQSPENSELDDYVLVNIPDVANYRQRRIFRAIAELPEVRWIETNEIIPISLPENPDNLEKQDFKPILNDPGIAYQWGYESMDMNSLHGNLLESQLKPRKVASLFIIDTGVDSKHEDLAANYSSYNAAFDTDPQGHGTHCAGIASAVSNNSLGIASFAPGTDYLKISGIRVANSLGVITQKAIIQAIISAADAGADVMNLSLGGPSSQKRERAYEEAVKYAAQKGSIVVVAAGNNGSDARYTAPANVKGVIAVAAVDQELNKAVFSNSVRHLGMGLCAPGVGIYSTLPNNRYGPLNGTSMAAPQVAGLIALLKAFYPDLTAKEAFYIVEKTGKKLPDSNLTGRFIQPGKALEELLD